MAAQPRWSQDDLWDLFDLSPVSESDIDKYLSVTLAKCVHWFRASGGSIFLKSTDQLYELRSKFGAQKKLPNNTMVSAGKGIAGIVAQSGVARLINDPSAYADMSEVDGNSGIVSSMVIPLLSSKREAIGILNISRRTGEEAFREIDLDQAVALAAHVSLAVSNAELVNHLKSSYNSAAVANEQLIAVLDSFGGSVWVVDSGGNVVNENFPAAQLSGQRSGKVVCEAFPKLIEESLSKGESVKSRVDDRISDRTWLVRVTPLESGGAVVAAQEITEHDRQNREFSRVKRLAEIGQMTASIAHEIRNPLTGIRSAAQMIREDNSLVVEFIGLIEEEALKLNTLCDEFLEFARPLSLNLSEQTLSEVISPVAAVLSSIANANKIELIFNPCGNDEKFEFDSRRIGQVVHNLVRNAIEVSSPGGKVLIESESYQFSVRDWGSGMEQETLENLFSPFFTTKSDGTGLGLCNCRKIIDAHGGEIFVQSRVGQGTTFTVQVNREKA